LVGVQQCDIGQCRGGLGDLPDRVDQPEQHVRRQRGHGVHRAGAVADDLTGQLHRPGPQLFVHPMVQADVDTRREQHGADGGQHRGGDHVGGGQPDPDRQVHRATARSR
jgi:hypothetical protein